MEYLEYTEECIVRVNMLRDNDNTMETVSSVIASTFFIIMLDSIIGIENTRVIMIIVYITLCGIIFFLKLYNNH